MEVTMKNKWIYALLALILASMACVNNVNGNNSPVATNAPANPAGNQPTAQSVTDPGQPAPVDNTGNGSPANLPMVRAPFQTPVKATSVFNNDSAWMIAEPGVINTNETAWTVAQVDAPYHQNVPEGAFAYFSLGQGNIAIDGVNLNLKGENGLNYLVVIRGSIDDNIVDSDLNKTAVVTNFVTGHAIWSYMPKGAYVSRNWFRQQLVASSTENFTNCGAEGCSRVRVVLFDVDSHKYQMFEVHAGSLDSWTLIEHN